MQYLPSTGQTALPGLQPRLGSPSPVGSASTNGYLTPSGPGSLSPFGVPSPTAANAPQPMSLRPHYNESNFIRFFRFYGLRLELVNKQLNGACPFHSCRTVHHDSPDHFFASPANGCWDCKYCHRSGNIYDFIRLFHAECFEQTKRWSGPLPHQFAATLPGTLTTPAQHPYEILSEKRKGIPAWVWPIFNFAINPLNGEWLIPAYNLKEHKLTNLYAWKQKSGKDGPSMAIYSGPCMKQLLYGLQYLRKDHHRPLLILEGQWDYLATWAMLYQLSLLDEIDLVATCGDQFPDFDLHILSGRDIIHHGDNDGAGESSFAKLLSQLGSASITPRSVRKMAFMHGEKVGLDVRDIINTQPSPQNAYSEIIRRYYPVQVDLQKHANPNYSPTLRKIPCTSFDDVLESLETKLYLPDCLKDTMAVIVAIASTTGLPGRPLWSHIVGPSGSSKTTLVSLVSSADPYCRFMSKWTGLVSGFYERGLGDLSPLQNVNHKCCCIEDFTPTINAPETEQSRIFSELREAYGGKIANFYRNQSGLKEFDNVHFHMLTCVTDRIRRINNTDLGERFLITDQDSYWSPEGHLIQKGIDRSKIVESSIESTLMEMAEGERDKFLEQRGTCWGFIDHIATRIKSEPHWYQHKVRQLAEDKATCAYYGNLAKWTAYARSFVERDREKQPKYVQRVEFGSRLSTQLTKLAIALSIIFDEEHDSERVKGIVRKVALDTGFGPQQITMLTLAQSSFGLEPSDIAERTGVVITTVMNRLRDMSDLDISTYREPLPHQRRPGNQPHRFYLSSELQTIATGLGFCPSGQVG